ncbi:MAG: adenosylmethionine decarboxylase [Aquificaceae bacterium]
MEKAIGLHILADLHGVDPALIDRVQDVRHLLETAVKVASLNKISSHYHQFQPHGATGVVLLAESHLSIHTWPEHGLAAVDVFTCGDPSKAYRAMEYIISSLSPTRVDKQVFDRAFIPSPNKDLRSILIGV